MAVENSRVPHGCYRTRFAAGREPLPPGVAGRWAATREELRTRREAEAQEQERQAVTHALVRKARNKARGRLQNITGRLRREALSTEQRQELVEEPVLAAEEAGDN